MPRHAALPEEQLIPLTPKRQIHRAEVLEIQRRFVGVRYPQHRSDAPVDWLYTPKQTEEN